MKTIHRYAVGLVLACVMAAPALAQVQAPAQPSGTKLTEADHRENVSRLNVFEWHVPGSDVRGISTYWPDGTSVVSFKQGPDGPLRHGPGFWRIDGDKFCTKPKFPAEASERCIHSYKTAENEYQAWNTDGSFSSYWRFRK